MRCCLRGCGGTLLALVVILAAAYVGWRWGAEIFPRVQAWFGAEDQVTPSRPEPSPELAHAAVARFEEFRADPQRPSQMILDEVEVESVLRYYLQGRLPPEILDPEVIFGEEDFHLRGRVPLEAFPRLPELQHVIALLPDTVQLEFRAVLQPFDNEVLAVQVRGIEAAGVAIPARFVPQILDALGRQNRSGLALDAVAISLPRGVRSAYVANGRLVILSGR